MRIRRTVPLALIVAALAASPSMAGAKLAPPKPLAWTDMAGDANALNDQGGLAPAGPGDTAGPAQDAAADILGVTFARLDDGKTLLGLTVTMKLSGAPSQGHLYRVTGAAGACSTFWFQFNWTAGGNGSSTLRHNCVANADPTSVGGTTNQTIDGKVVGNSIVWTLLVKELPPGVKVGSPIAPALGETRAIIGVAGAPQSLTAPVIDQTATQSAAYKIGQ
ncbi:MAG: hypothetical protein JWP11_2948 [Frankiales bacterium]|jgi:hypothetical protein|nr:hypothetical protein [Frankiales bacterium]